MRYQLFDNAEDPVNTTASDEDEKSSQISSGSSSRSSSTNSGKPASNVGTTLQAWKADYDQSTLLWKEHEPIAQRLATYDVIDSDPRLKELALYVDKSRVILGKIANATSYAGVEQLNEEQQTQPVVRGLLDACFRYVAQNSFQVFLPRKMIYANKCQDQVRGIPDMAIKPRKLVPGTQADKIHAAILVGEVKKTTLDVEKAYCNQCMWYAEGVLLAWPEALVDLLRKKEICFFAVTTSLTEFRFIETQEFPSTNRPWTWSRSERITDSQLVAKEILYLCLAAKHMLESIPKMTYVPRYLDTPECEPGNEGSGSSLVSRGSQSSSSASQNKGRSSHHAKEQRRGTKQQGPQDQVLYANSYASTLPRNQECKKKQAKSKSSLTIPLDELKAVLGQLTLEERIRLYQQQQS